MPGELKELKSCGSGAYLRDVHGVDEEAWWTREQACLRQRAEGGAARARVQPL